MKGFWEHDVFFFNKTNMTVGIVRWESINVQILAQRLIAYILIPDWGMRTLTQSSASTLAGSGCGWHLPDHGSEWVSVHFPLRTLKNSENSDDEVDDINHLLSHFSHA